MRTAFPPLVVLALCACGPALLGEPELAVVEGAPATGTPAGRSEIAVSRPLLLAVVDGVAAAATPEGLRVGSVDQPEAFTAVPLKGGAAAPGAGLALARRAPAGALLAAEHGLFHTANGGLYPSPLAASLGEARVRTLDAFGEGADEELWLITDDGALHVGGGELLAVALTGVEARPELAVAVGPGRALIAAGGDAYLVDLREGTLSLEVRGLGEVRGFSRSDSGAVYLAAESGLLVREADGALSLRTFANPGEQRPGAFAVSAAFDRVMVLTGRALVEVTGAGEARALGEVAAPSAVAVDALGDAWAIDGETLVRFKTGAVVSFEASAKPFFTQHCMGCHRTGAAFSPVLNFESYEVAKSLAANILKRLRAQGVNPMPPADVEVLSPSDYAVISRWIGGGLKP